MTAVREGQVFPLPDLGEGLVDAEIITWRVAVGDTVEVDQVVAEVETVKAAVEIPVPYAGTVLALHAETGSVLAVGAPLISVGRSTTADTPGPTGTVPAAPAVPAGGSGNVLVGYGTKHAPARRRARDRGDAGRTVPTVQPLPASGDIGDTGRAAAPLVISPLVRAFARKHGVDLTRLSPSGPHGVILRRDVERAVERPAEPAVARADQPARTDTEERIPLRGLRRVAAEKLSRSNEIPDATAWVDVDATELVQARETLRSKGPGSHISLLALLARICVAGLRRFPELNATVDVARGEIVRFSAVHLGFAAQTERGLIVPVVRDAHRRTTAELAAELRLLTDQARTNGLRPTSLTGGTFTLNNYGVFGVDGSAALINHPEAAILGIGRIIDRPWVVEGELAVRKVAQLSLTFDHRACDGGTAGGFLRFVADCVERPALLLADL
ncbi:2-oxoisovalerate dehydrogenase E2 component (dihydrolipoyl transacylase) [Streptacidiphilus sp. MAP12-33]|uniref:dihydrolipoamide acetyltransferase family protein n=1 Tax=Streptacidiphilus sp. MAP12-33 TaxID=3156266 RepID=UPI003518A4B4